MYHSVNVAAFPKPVQKPGIPIYIGGFGDGPFRRVAALGDGGYPMSLSPKDVIKGLSLIRPLMEKQGRDPASLWVGVSGLDIGGGETRKWQHDVLGQNSPVEMPPPVDTIAQAVDLAGEYLRAGARYMSVSFKWRSSACYVQDAAKRLAAHGDRGPARQIAPLVSYSIAAVERRMAAHHGFRIHAEKTSRLMVEALKQSMGCGVGEAPGPAR